MRRLVIIESTDYVNSSRFIVCNTCQLEGMKSTKFGNTNGQIGKIIHVMSEVFIRLSPLSLLLHITYTKLN